LSSSRRKVVTGVVGALLIVAAGALSVFPGPLSIPLMLAGLTVLSWEFSWARNGRKWLVAKFRQFNEWRKARKGGGHAGDSRSRRVA
ncbi:MAG: PGPGW domain-containing protein, partial [Actinomycetota bacterium]